MIEQILNIAKVYTYISIPIITLIGLMVLSWLLAISVREDGTVYISKGSLFYKFRLAMVFPMVNLIALPELRYGWEYYTDSVREELNQHTIVSNLCKIFWSSVFSVLILLPLNLVVVGIALCLTPFVLIVWVVKLLVEGLFFIGNKTINSVSEIKKHKIEMSEEEIYRNARDQFVMSQYPFIKEELMRTSYYMDHYRIFILELDHRYDYSIFSSIVDKLQTLYTRYDSYSIIARDIEAMREIIEMTNNKQKKIKMKKSFHKCLLKKDKKLIDEFYNKYQIITAIKEIKMELDKRSKIEDDLKREREVVEAARKRKKDMLLSWYRKWLCPEIKVVE